MLHLLLDIILHLTWSLIYFILKIIHIVLFVAPMKPYQPKRGGTGVKRECAGVQNNVKSEKTFFPLQFLIVEAQELCLSLAFSGTW